MWHICLHTGLFSSPNLKKIIFKQKNPKMTRNWNNVLNFYRDDFYGKVLQDDDI